jgi:hypothetical protein
MNFYQAMGLFSVALAVASFAPYIIQIRSGTMKPHVFSWIIWSISTAVVYFAQVVADGGPGAWPTGVSGLMTMYVTWLAWSKASDIEITKSDWGFLGAALVSLPAWYITSDPLWAVVILTTIDLLGFGPTIRKLYQNPYEESVLFYLMFTVRSAVSILALESLNMTTLLFPIAMVVSCGAVCVLLLWRRQALPR